ncbi:molybdopterin molybdotransferase MoeA [Sphingomonas sp.]|uniref:molybdopterin molybdotransferase MoeA n=1 Tax=Sphingomonas sp. TaxID=28214 RepID=UPI00286A8CD0|nr:molybdopterin molybdotransferase MoeA [Sphingomonas sp.]
MITLDQAWAIIGGAAEPLASETVALADAAGRVLASPIIATVDSPRGAVSTMDGYAIRDGDGPTLRLVGTSAAGARFTRSVGQGEAVRIFTGAALPQGASRVVIQENVTVDGDRITINQTSAASFVRHRASDFAAGDEVVAAGNLLTPGALVAAAGAGPSHVQVTRRPRVLTIATGDELVSVGAALDADHIPDSLAPGLTAMIAAMGATMLGHQLVGDDLPALEAAAASTVARCDLVVITGGASVGARDHAKAMFAPLGLELMFSKVAIKPGKPVWLGRVGETSVMGLPGNPSSAMVTARLLLAPLVARLLGQRDPAPIEWLSLPLAAPLPATDDRETFTRATLSSDGLTPLANQDSGAQCALGQARWLLRCPAGQGPLAAGTFVTALSF